MAKVLDPLRSAEARGKVGGLIYNTSRGAKYVKTFTSPVQRRSAAQLLIRSLMANTSRAWQAATPAQRTAWQNWANAHPVQDWTGNSRTLSGFNAYCKLNTTLALLGSAENDAPPSGAGPAAPTTFAAANGVGQSIVTWSAMGGTDKQVVIWGYGPHSAGLTAKIERAKTLDNANGEAATITITGLTPGLWTLWGRTVDEDDGQQSTLVSDTSTIT